jgi:hypothetical protein
MVLTVPFKVAEVEAGSETVDHQQTAAYAARSTWPRRPFVLKYFLLLNSPPTAPRVTGVSSGCQHRRNRMPV